MSTPTYFHGWDLCYRQDPVYSANIDKQVKGRIDLTMMTATAIYILEFKIKGTAQSAIDRINDESIRLDTLNTDYLS